VAGRPTKLTPETTSAILRDLSDGLPRTTACERAGVAYSTLKLWLKKGRAAKAGAYFAFSAGLKKAEADAVARNVATVQRAAAERDEVTVKQTVKPDGTRETVTTTRRVFEWTAAAWWLERKFPEDWSSARGELAELRRRVAEIEAAAAGRNADHDATEAAGNDGRGRDPTRGGRRRP